jgi:tetratricopeptide (TPR) repeat protein
MKRFECARYVCIVALVVVVDGLVVKSHAHVRNFMDDVCLFTRAVAIHESRCDLQLHYLLATAYLTQDKNVVDALRHAKIAADRTSYDAVNHAIACTKYAGMKRYDKAFDECVKALRLEPSNPNFQRNLALLSIDAHRVENARQVIRELSGEVPVLHCLDAMVAYEVGVIFYGDALKACKPYMDKGFSLSR